MSRVFNGTTSRIDIANEAAFDFERTQAFSGHAWIGVASAIDGPIMAKQENSGLFRGWDFGVAGFQGPRLFLDLHSDDGAANFAQRETDVAFSTGTWHAVGFSYDGSSAEGGMLFYVDGVLAASTGLGGTLSATILNAIPLQFGCRGGTGAPGFFYAGSQAAPGVWTSVLTATDFLKLANGYFPGEIAQSSLVSWWGMRENLANEPDLKAGANAGTLNAASYSTDDPIPLRAKRVDSSQFPKSKLRVAA